MYHTVRMEVLLSFVSEFLRETFRKQTVILNQEGKKEKLSPRLTWLTKTRYVKSASVFIAALNLREKKPDSKRGAISVPLEKLSECYSPFFFPSFFLVERPYQFWKMFYENKISFFFCKIFLKDLFKFLLSF